MLKQLLNNAQDHMRSQLLREAAEEPLRLELLSIEQLEQLARERAGEHVLRPGAGSEILLVRLADNQRVLQDTYHLITAAVNAGQAIAPASEWLLDNFYILDEEIRLIRRHLPRGYARQLPVLAMGPQRLLPRIYDMALCLISHLDGRVDTEAMSRFIAAYQQTRSLTLGELWALPIMLRLALVENMRRVAGRIAQSRHDRNLANHWADELIAAAAKSPDHTIVVLADMVKSNPPLTSAFVADLVRRLQGQSSSLVMALDWVQQLAVRASESLERLVQQESQRQAADQISMGNCFASLRFIDATDWMKFVEGHSVIEQRLRSDPAGLYAQADFQTRDRCRHVIEDLARRGKIDELAVAEKALLLAQSAVKDFGVNSRQAHVGFYLIDQGRLTLEGALKAYPPLRARLQRMVLKNPLLAYLSVAAILTLAPVALLLRPTVESGMALWCLVILALLATLVISQGALAVVNELATRLIPARLLPRLDFEHGVPDDCRTLVVIPSMLEDPGEVRNLLEQLEVRFLANRNPNLLYALLTDYCDAPQQIMPEDESLLRQAVEGIEQLNQRYAQGNIGPFCLFHRPRHFNEREGVWMGYERKRGKLAETMEWLRGGAQDRFLTVIGDAEVLAGVKFLITLDADTQLPRGTAIKLIGTMAHVLNRPQIDSKTGLVRRGYGILQPRVAVHLPASRRSWFVRLFGGDAGLDPYTRAVSDVYQDLFGEGSFVGKGIIDIDAFHTVLHKRFPENRILSHDLLEGCHVRSGLVSDVQLFEEFPSHFTADVNRRHRWIRGDWQIVGYLLPWVRDMTGRRLGNRLSALSRWKIFDNLRRSLWPPAVVALFAWLCLGLGPSWAWALGLLAVVFAPLLLSSVFDLATKSSDLPINLHLNYWAAGLASRLTQGFLLIVFAGFEAVICLQAIGQTLTRLLFTRRHLLQWRSSGLVARGVRHDLSAFVLGMWVAPILGAGLVLCTWLIGDGKLLLAAGPCLLWILSPVAAWLLSRPLDESRSKLDAKTQQFLRALARRTWHFFETFVVAEDHFLPPDNYQEYPKEKIAHRTSPTNIGLAALANLAAFDAGWISAGTLLFRTRAMFDTMDRLTRYRGHFFNWYDTQTLEPLSPLYVSTVDSGNLAGHLLVLKSGFDEMRATRPLPQRWAAGLGDVLLIIKDSMAADALGAASGQLLADASPGAQVRQLEQLIEQMSACDDASLPESVHALEQCVKLSAAEAHAADAASEASSNVRGWIEMLSKQAADLREDLVWLAPWVKLPPPPDMSPADAEMAGLWREHSRHYRALNQNVGLSDLVIACQAALDSLPGLHAAAIEPQYQQWRDQWESALRLGLQRLQSRLNDFDRVGRRAAILAQMDFKFLYDTERKLLSIGFSVSDNALDKGFYDLLASEARLTSYIGIVQGQLPQEHWFALGRPVTGRSGQLALLSWSGSMFEYLMPQLVMPQFAGTLLDQTMQAVVDRNISYANDRGIPWGVSESGYNATDAQLNYQYRAFGVPGLGFKRRLSEDVVIAPYASMLALLASPQRAATNLLRLKQDGQMGRYGFYEAIDYTASRVPEPGTPATVRSFMSHHQGMGLLGVMSFLLHEPMQRRFSADPLLRSGELLLQEKIPRVAGIFPHSSEVAESRRPVAQERPAWRVFSGSATPAPEAHLISNGRYHVMVTTVGSGRSLFNDLALTRWQADYTRDCWGLYCYIRDLDSQRWWSAGISPAGRVGQAYEAVFSEGKAEFQRRDGSIETRMTIAVSPEDDIELRRILLTNRGKTPRTIEVTSYGEVVLQSQTADAAHPAFGNLFVQTSVLSEHCALLATRRARSNTEQPPWLIHQLTVHGAAAEFSYQTGREAFIGRGRSAAQPLAMDRPGPLGNFAGAPLDPIVAIRRHFVIEPEQTICLDMLLGVGATRQQVEAMAARYSDRRLTDRVMDLAWSHNQVMLQQLGATEAEAQLFGRLAGALLYPGPALRAGAETVRRNVRGQSGLWGFAISGDLPILLLRVENRDNLSLVRDVLKAHAYWRLKGLAVDLVIWNQDTSIYRQDLHEQLLAVIAAGPDAKLLDRPGGIFLRRLDQLTEDDRLLLLATAAVVLSDGAGTLEEQLDRPGGEADAIMPRLVPVSQPQRDIVPPPARREDLQFFNGIGGLTGDAREYVMTVSPDKLPPSPWCNVIAGEQLGTVVSESGGMYTWVGNAHEYRLTPWYNDAVTDATGEALYIRDDQTGLFWSPCGRNSPGGIPGLTRHGFGYSIFERTQQGIYSELKVYAALREPVKFCVLKVVNRSAKARTLSVTNFCEWVLGENRSRNAGHVVTELDEKTGAILAHNYWNADFAGWVAFAHCSENARSVTGDRTEFLGRNGSVDKPAAMSRRKLSGRLGGVYDPCAAMMCAVELAPGASREIVFILGAAPDLVQARQLIERFRTPGSARRALETVWQYWNRTLGCIHLETPDAGVNALANGWLLYQVISSRMWGRSGFYQSGGAYGFRDQLQDAMAAALASPELLRSQILRAASRQFEEGDAQHWWHPPVGRGVRTAFSDDFLWLPLAVCRYVELTRDTGVLEEKVGFLQGRPLAEHEESWYDLPGVSGQEATLWQHCVRAVNRGLRTGEHGLPLIGCGDWNDGFNRIGLQGRGESVWLAFFQRKVLDAMAQLAENRQDTATAELCRKHAAQLLTAVEESAWDGQWYRRAFFDDGAPLGSAQNEQCRIDSLPQSWALISQTGNAERQRLALAAVEDHLVSRDLKLIRLFDPPFDHPLQDPGYIAGYLPGVRENGGQYTHAAVWVVMAFAMAGQVDKAWELFELINPLLHSRTPQEVTTYRVEPYVLAADVYSVAPHQGRGGWTWYTGSAGWMYRLLIEVFLGWRQEADRLWFEPRLPQHWKGFQCHYRYRETFYHIHFSGGGDKVRSVQVDGKVQDGCIIILRDDRQEHQVQIEVIL